MSEKPENVLAYYKRKLEEIREFINVAIEHPDIVQSVFIGDGIAVQSGGQTGLAVINLKVDLREQQYYQLKKKK